MAKMKASLVPVISSFSERLTVIFSYPLESNEDDDIFDQDEGLVEWIDQVHETYYKTYSGQSSISRALRTVDAQMLSVGILQAIMKEKTHGDIYFNIVVNIDNNANQQVFTSEYVQYIVQWLDGPPKIAEIFPIGFQTLHNYRVDDKTITSSVVFDTRVAYDEMATSLEYVENTYLSRLSTHFTHVKNVAEMCKASHDSIDFDKVKFDLHALIKTIYDTRRQDETILTRETIYLDTIIIPMGEEKSHLSLHIRMDVEITSTPDLLPTNPEYRAEPGDRNVFVHSYNKMTISEDVQKAIDIINGNQSEDVNKAVDVMDGNQDG